MSNEFDVRDVVYATGNGTLVRHHERLFGDDPVQGIYTVGDCAFLAAASYEKMTPLYNNNNLNESNADPFTVKSKSPRLSAWTCVKTWDFPGQHDSFLTVLPNALAGIDLSKFNIDGFYAALFRATRSGDHGFHYVLAFRGTEKPSCSDWVNDVQQALAAFSLQYAHVSEIIGKYLIDFMQDANTLTFTGHSLGGGLATLASTMIPYVPAITFNAAGLNKATAAEARGYMTGIGFDEDYRSRHFPRSLGRSMIHANYNVKYEVLSTLQKDWVLCGHLLGHYLSRKTVDALDATTASVLREVLARPVRSAAIAGGGVIAAPFVLPAVAEVAADVLPVAASDLAKMLVRVKRQGGLPAAGDVGWGDFEIPCIEGVNFIDLHLMEHVLVALGLPGHDGLATRLTWLKPGDEVELQ